MSKRAVAAEVCKRLGEEVIPVLNDKDLDAFLALARKLHVRAEQIKSANDVSNLSLSELLNPGTAAARRPPPPPPPPLQVQRPPPTPPTVLPQKKRVVRENDDEEGIARLVPWDLDAHAFCERVVSVDGDDLIIEARRTSHHTTSSFVRVKPEQVSSINKRRWPAIMSFFMVHPMPAALENTPFGRHFRTHAPSQ